MQDAGFTPSRITPPERQLPFLRSLQAMLDNPMEAWPREMYEAPSYVPPRRDFPLLYLCDPDAIRSVLVDRVGDFPKAPVWMRLIEPLLGQGLLTSEGAQWRWQRRAAAPAFQPNQILSCAGTVTGAAERALARWSEAPHGAVRDMGNEFTRITFEIILDAMFGGRKEHDIDAMSEAFARYLSDLGRPNLVDLLGAPSWLRRLAAPGACAAVDYMRAAVDAMIARRRREGERGDLIDALMGARDNETGRAMTDAELRDNLLTFLAGGHETTALALTWALFLVSSHAPSQARIREEVLRVAGAGPIDAAALPNLVFTKHVLQEALRLYPPFPALSRVARSDCALAGRRVRAGDIIVIPVYALHRHKLYWRDPDRFDPDRFAAGEPLAERRYVYMPFGGGPRICIGAAFAMMEATLVLATLVRGAHFEALAERWVRPLLRITLRPEGGLPTRVSMIEPHQRICAA